MNVELRLLKQFIIIGIVAVFLGAIVLLAFRAFHKPAPVATPDPLAGIKQLEVVDTYLFQVNEHDYDYLAKIRNPNARFGAEQVPYTIELFWDSTGANEQSIKVSGTFYILPGQTKYIFRTPIKTTNAITRTKLTIDTPDWRELDPLAAQGVNLVATSSVFTPHADGPIYGTVGGSVRNTSDFDLQTVDVVTILFDADNVPLAAGKTEVRTFLAHATRGFEVSWYAPVDGTVAKVYTEAMTNLFENSTFLRTNGSLEQFQEPF